MSRITVLWRDADWLAVAKPAGWVTTSPAPEGLLVLTERAQQIARGAKHCHPLSRLDVDVTGVVLFALTRGALDRATRARDDGTYAREYIAVLCATPDPRTGRWDDPIGVDPKRAERRVAGRGRDVQPAASRYVVERALSGGACLARFMPETGRTHQLRVHASAHGCPVAGDALYGAPRRVVRDDGGVVAVGRVMLHAASVRVPGRDNWIDAPWPDDLTSLVDALSPT